MKEEIKHEAKLAGLRSIALFEAVKGGLVLVVGFGLLHYLHRDLGEEAERIVRQLHMNPTRHYAHVFLEAADKVTDAKLWALSAGAAAYSAVRFTEAYGLWHERDWAEWFALLSGGLYLPWEIYELLERATLIRVAVLVMNVLIVLYMISLRWSERKKA